MPRTSLAQHLLSAQAVVAEAAARRVPPDQILAEQAARPVSRRDFLKAAGLTAGAAALNHPLANAATAPRIVIVGAGLAGLSAAYQLRKSGYLAQVYDAADRVGGRCWTHRGYFDEGQITEHGGELIDQGHTAVRHLAQELGLDLDNLLQAEKNGTDPFYYFDGAPYTYAQAVDDLNGMYQKMHRDLSDASYPTLYNLYTQRGWELDHMSIVDWINETVPGGEASKLGQLLDVAYNIEFGAECGDQSSLNLLYLLGYSGQGQLNTFGKSNEKYHVRGGNDQIPARLAAALAGQIHLGQELTAIKRSSNGSYALTFKSGKKSTAVTADKVVLALPFSILRHSVDYSQAGFRPLKQTAIQQQGMGTNSKLQLQFASRLWENLGSNGETYADTGYQNTWEVTRGQPGQSGILVDYTGGLVGASFGSGTLPARAQQFLAQLEPVLPGISAEWNGKAALDFWTGYEWTRGSYSYWKVGQYTGFSGIEREPEGSCYFAGEHTSVDFQGYLNGAVDSGQQAADALAATL
jgi:monoamine oxidase